MLWRTGLQGLWLTSTFAALLWFLLCLMRSNWSNGDTGGDEHGVFLRLWLLPLPIIIINCFSCCLLRTIFILTKPSSLLSDLMRVLWTWVMASSRLAFMLFLIPDSGRGPTVALTGSFIADDLQIYVCCWMKAICLWDLYRGCMTQEPVYLCIHLGQCT